MFIGRFNQVTSSKFNADRNGQMPYVATVLAGTATSSIMNASIFEGGSNVSGQLYLCENNSREYDGKMYPTVEIVATVSAIEYIQLRKELGAGRLAAPKVVEVVDEEAHLD